ncbi:G-rich domain on putative tyrosine kinase [Thiohalospira halophila DSM 15071]|uniref:G-rich domain on putative tyrosine kinase n=1 Tax=Thiohalospira halophila DSM 15071 TaxID=1123397 RepID=A0A1I1T7Z8_9GAMM|nr:Wzz/FepE/Etk N-terminal domain-containing protein [Thiohalospira halophila]SFD54749.1 G-rich domain on putative tyrosine kinase [Thiohalospira halophila DSM 15071]
MATQQPPHDTPYADDEISLIDLWRVLARRRFWILATFVLVMVLAGAWLALKTPVYEASASIEIGTVAAHPDKTKEVYVLDSPQKEDSPKPRSSLELLEDPAAVTNRLNSSLQSGTAEVQSGRIIQLTTRSEDPEQATRQLRGVLEELRNRHAGYLETFRSNIRERAEEVNQRIGFIEDQQAQFEAKLGELDANTSAAIGALLTLEQRLFNRLPQLEEQRRELLNQLSERLTQPTRIIAEPTATSNPVEPKNRLVLALAAVLGLMLGVFVAFFREFLTRVAEAGEEETE